MSLVLTVTSRSFVFTEKFTTFVDTTPPRILQNGDRLENGGWEQLLKNQSRRAIPLSEYLLSPVIEAFLRYGKTFLASSFVPAVHLSCLQRPLFPPQTSLCSLSRACTKTRTASDMY